ncbi:unnamed protein product [Prunus armeniaca]
MPSAGALGWVVRLGHCDISRSRAVEDSARSWKKDWSWASATLARVEIFARVVRAGPLCDLAGPLETRRSWEAPEVWLLGQIPIGPESIKLRYGSFRHSEKFC